MLRFAQFTQECPVCGRPLEIRIEYLGRRVGCQHCGGRFVASEPAARPGRPPTARSLLLRRAESLLELSARRLGFANRLAGG